MSAVDIRIATAIVSHNQFDSFTPTVVSPNISFHQALEFRNFATLSSHNPNNHRLIEGLLYVPTLSTSAATVCSQALQIIPENAVRLSDLPTNQNYPLVAIFPWTTVSECTEAFIFQARIDAARAALVYQPDTGNALSSNMNWRLSGDRGNSVVRWNPFPIYTLTDTVASQILQESAEYSTNMSASPYGPELEQQYDSLDFPRLLARIQLQGRSGLSFTWITIIITLSILLIICFLCAFAAHLMRRHYRRRLQRRVEAGEVDLQSLGIKKLKLPQEQIDAMPKLVYKTEQRFSNKPDAKVASFSQSTCPVCLDDFVANETMVRELPCKHIFHPECIDPFLRDSSCCAICKASARPKGYHPEITDIMVRRERLARRIRAERQQQLRATSRQSTSIQSASLSNADVELGQTGINTTQPQDTQMIPPEIASQGHEARVRWRREQISRQQEEQYNREAETTRQADIGRPLWRRIMGRIIPATE